MNKEYTTWDDIDLLEKANKEDSNVTVKLHKTYWDDSPITEKQLKEYSAYEEYYVSSLLEDCSTYVEDKELDRIMVRAEMPNDRSMELTAGWTPTLNTKDEKIEESLNSNMRIVSNRNNAYEAELKALVDAFPQIEEEVETKV